MWEEMLSTLGLPQESLEARGRMDSVALGEEGGVDGEGSLDQEGQGVSHCQVESGGGARDSLMAHQVLVVVVATAEVEEGIDGKGESDAGPPRFFRRCSDIIA
jgi:hypothetical protein